MEKELNLLPPNRRRLVDRQATMGLVAAIVNHLVIGLSALTFVGLIALGGVHLMVLFTGGSTTSSLQKGIEDYQTKREEIARQNSALKILHGLSTNKISWSERLPDLLAVLPAGTTINKIEANQESRNLDFEGQATSRTSLIALTDRLEKLDWAQSVSAPATNLIERVNPLYSFDIIIKDNPDQENND